MSKKNHIIITTLLICSFLLLTVQIVRAGTHSSHFALNGGASATLGNIIILNKELQTTQTI